VHKKQVLSGCLLWLGAYDQRAALGLMPRALSLPTLRLQQLVRHLKVAHSPEPKSCMELAKFSRQ